ncbi:MAG: prolipoprotein diacylglyceryl transferase [Bacilli bacterium]|nr:prolipoprotein diacylglyceryl transferase [Bacilli bacterium]
MYPNLFGIEGSSMAIMMGIGAIVAVLVTFLFLRKHGLDTRNKIIDYFIVVLATIFMGILFAMLFENIYEAIKHSINGEPQAWTWNKTFYGGLFGGVATFLLVYRFYYLRNNPPIIKEVLKIAPSAICFGHGIGRLGCFLNGCCYGLETESPLGMYFPGHDHKVFPTQLYEMVFLLILATILLVLAFKEITVYTMPIYLLSYGIFRFLIEFIRGDERGQLQGLSPSQYWCISLVIASIVLYIIYKKVIFPKEEEPANEI